MVEMFIGMFGVLLHCSGCCMDDDKDREYVAVKLYKRLKTLEGWILTQRGLRTMIERVLGENDGNCLDNGVGTSAVLVSLVRQLSPFIVDTEA